MRCPLLCCPYVAVILRGTALFVVLCWGRIARLSPAGTLPFGGAARALLRVAMALTPLGILSVAHWVQNAREMSESRAVAKCSVLTRLMSSGSKSDRDAKQGAFLSSANCFGKRSFLVRNNAASRRGVINNWRAKAERFVRSSSSPPEAMIMRNRSGWFNSVAMLEHAVCMASR